MDSRTTHVSLLERIAVGEDPIAWREFVERYGDLVRGFGRRRGLSPTDCDDLLQDVLANFLAVLPRFRYDPSKGRFRGYLKTIAIHAILRRFHQKDGEVDLSEFAALALDRSAMDAADAEWEAEWRQYHLRRAMRTIDAEFGASDRAAFQRYALDGGSASATAEALGLSVDQVYQAKSRILRRLSELVREQIEDEG